MIIDIAPNFERPGVVCGFVLSWSPAAPTIPKLSSGVLFAQGTMYRPAAGNINIPAPPTNSQSWLCYSSSTGFYWRSTPTVQTAGDAGPIGWLVTHGATIVAASRQQMQVADRAGTVGAVISLGPVVPADDSTVTAGSTIPGTPDNWLVNPGFELDLAGWTASGVTIQVGGAFTGTKCAVIAANGQVSQTELAGVRPGDQMTAEAYIKSGAGASCGIQLVLRFYDSAGNALAGTDRIASTQPAISTWTKIYVSGAVPAGASSCGFVVVAGSGSGSWFVDAALLYRSISIGSGLAYDEYGGVKLIHRNYDGNGLLNPQFIDGFQTWDFSHAGAAVPDATDGMVPGGICVNIPGTDEYFMSAWFSGTSLEATAPTIGNKLGVTFECYVKAIGNPDSTVAIELVQCQNFALGTEANPLTDYYVNDARFASGGMVQAGCSATAAQAGSDWKLIGGQSILGATNLNKTPRWVVMIHVFGGTGTGHWLIDGIRAVVRRFWAIGGTKYHYDVGVGGEYLAVEAGSGLTVTDGQVNLGTTTPDNWVMNPGFEDGFAHWTPDASATIVESGSYTGAKCARLPGVSTLLLSEQYAIRPGDQIAAEVYLKADVGCNTTGTLTLYWYNAARNSIESPVTASLAYGGAAAWTKVSLTGTAPAGASWCAVAIMPTGGTGAGAWLIDNVVCRRVPPAGSGLTTGSDGTLQVRIATSSGLAINAGGAVQVQIDSSKAMAFDAQGRLVINIDSNDFQFVGNYLKQNKIDLSKAVNFDTSEFQGGAGITFSQKAVNAEKMTLGSWLRVGYAGANPKPGQIIVYGAGETMVGWIGQNGTYFGGAFKQLYVAYSGSDPSTAKLIADSSGNLSIKDASITITSSNGTLSIDSTNGLRYTSGSYISMSLGYGFIAYVDTYSNVHAEFGAQGMTVTQSGYATAGYGATSCGCPGGYGNFASLRIGNMQVVDSSRNATVNSLIVNTATVVSAGAVGPSYCVVGDAVSGTAVRHAMRRINSYTKPASSDIGPYELVTFWDRDNVLGDGGGFYLLAKLDSGTNIFKWKALGSI
jgi:hypothetical protein